MKKTPVTDAQKQHILKVLYEDENKLCSEYWALRECYDWGYDGPFNWHKLLRLAEEKSKEKEKVK